MTSKPGKHGTLHLYAIKYTDPDNEGFGQETGYRWGYNADHARERFEGHELNEGFQVIKVSPVVETD